MKEKNNKLRNGGMLIMLILLLVSFAVGVKLLTKNKSSEDLTTINGIYDAIKKETAYQFNNVDPAPATTTANGIPVSVNGFEYRVSTDAVPSLKFALGEPEDQPDQTYKDHTPVRANNIPEASSAYTAVMDRAGFTKIYDGEDITPNNLWSTIYKKGDITCTRNDHGASFMTISCYTDVLMLQTAAAARDFVSAFQWYEDNPKINFTDTYIGSFKIIEGDQQGSSHNYPLTASKSKDYQLAELTFVIDGVEDHTYNFYRKDEIGQKWQYAGVTDAYCSFYKQDPDMRKAFYDQPCTTDKYQTEYKRLDSNNPLPPIE